MIRGRHTFVWGGQLEEGYDNYLQTNTGGGLISFGWVVDVQPGHVEAGNVAGPGNNGGMTLPTSCWDTATGPRRCLRQPDHWLAGDLGSGVRQADLPGLVFRRQLACHQ